MNRYILPQSTHEQARSMPTIGQMLREVWREQTVWTGKDESIGPLKLIVLAQT